MHSLLMISLINRNNFLTLVSNYIHYYMYYACKQVNNKKPQSFRGTDSKVYFVVEIFFQCHGHICKIFLFFISILVFIFFTSNDLIQIQRILLLSFIFLLNFVDTRIIIFFLIIIMLLFFNHWELRILFMFTLLFRNALMSFVFNTFNYKLIIIKLLFFTFFLVFILNGLYYALMQRRSLFFVLLMHRRFLVNSIIIL